MTHETEQVRSRRHQRSASVVLRQPINLPEHDLATRLQVLVQIGLWIERHGRSLPSRSQIPEVRTTQGYSSDSTGPGNPALEAHLRVDGDGLALRINAYAARWTGGGCRPVLELAGLECALALVALDECLAWS